MVYLSSFDLRIMRQVAKPCVPAPDRGAVAQVRELG